MLFIFQFFESGTLLNDASYRLVFISDLKVPEDVMMKCRFSYIEQGDPVFLENLSQNLSDPGIEDGYHSYLDNCFAGLLQVS